MRVGWGGVGVRWHLLRTVHRKTSWRQDLRDTTGHQNVSGVPNLKLCPATFFSRIWPRIWFTNVFFFFFCLLFFLYWMKAWDTDRGGCLWQNGWQLEMSMKNKHDKSSCLYHHKRSLSFSVGEVYEHEIKLLKKKKKKERRKEGSNTMLLTSCFISPVGLMRWNTGRKTSSTAYIPPGYV